LGVAPSLGCHILFFAFLGGEIPFFALSWGLCLLFLHSPLHACSFCGPWACPISLDLTFSLNVDHRIFSTQRSSPLLGLSWIAAPGSALPSTDVLAGLVLYTPCDGDMVYSGNLTGASNSFFPPRPGPNSSGPPFNSTRTCAAIVYSEDLITRCLALRFPVPAVFEAAPGPAGPHSPIANWLGLNQAFLDLGRLSGLCSALAFLRTDSISLFLFLLDLMDVFLRPRYRAGASQFSPSEFPDRS